jgi:hypothetical protein
MLYLQIHIKKGVMLFICVHSFCLEKSSREAQLKKEEIQNKNEKKSI